MEIINVCQLAEGNWQATHTLAYYSHLIPVFISLLLAIFVFFATKSSNLARVFSLFVTGFCLWLIGDVTIWVSNDYHLITAVWAPLDYINIVFYLFGAFFFALLVNDGKKLPTWFKVVLITLSVPAWWITITGQSISGFNQPQCEAFNSELLTNYKLAIEWLVCIYIVIKTFNVFIKSDRSKKIQTTVVATGLILFFATFSVTEYISSQTGIYEINLYSLFILPVFLALMIYSITNLKMFQLRLIGTQLLVYVLLVMVGSQFFFLENTTNQILTIVTFIISFFFGVILLRNVKREAAARIKIEKLAGDLQKANDRLQELDKQKSEFVSFASHQLRSPLTSMRGYASLLLEGDYGDISDKVKEAVTVIYKSTRSLVSIVEDYLNISRMELGTMKYDMKVFDSKELLKTVISEQKPNIDLKGLVLNVNIDESKAYMINADSDKFKQVLMNTIDNSVKYTPSGNINVSLEKDEKRHLVRFSVTDTGVGIAKDTLPKLFKKFSRADHASESNIHGTGLGLFIARQMMDAHNGRIWAESAGENKGSQFYVEIPEVR